MFNLKDKPCFRTFQEAGRFFKRDYRTMKKFEGLLFTIDSSLPSISTKWITCKACGNQTPKSKARHHYCKDCSKEGKGRKNQGKLISTIYKGENNPNYLNGQAPITDYNRNDWYKLKKELNYKECSLTGITDNIDYHHIIPRWFCTLVDIDVYDKNNIIGINHQYHKVVHHLQLDIQLLPILYYVYKMDAQLLHIQFVSLLKQYKVHQYPVEQLQSLSLFQLARYPGKKKLLNHLPEFLQPFLNHLA
jgi:predicted RNA-binding Zn-ribbon protein involved in translation (DUF1610 family)